jgi:hypothetical protein
MRGLVDVERLRRFMRELGGEAERPARVYFTGGATAVLGGWRGSTIDVDLVFVPEEDRLFRAIPKLKERLEINVEIASPAHFLPELPGWEGRSLFIGREGLIDFFHYDPYAQALAKIERDHQQDRGDVGELIARGLVEPAELLRLFEAIEPGLYRFPAVDPAALRRAVEAVVGAIPGG